MVRYFLKDGEVYKEEQDVKYILHNAHLHCMWRGIIYLPPKSRLDWSEYVPIELDDLVDYLKQLGDLRAILKIMEDV